MKACKVKWCIALAWRGSATVLTPADNIEHGWRVMNAPARLVETVVVVDRDVCRHHEKYPNYTPSRSAVAKTRLRTRRAPMKSTARTWRVHVHSIGRFQ